MPDKPILFSAPMVRALLDGRKTQTRRLLKQQPERDADHWRLGDIIWFEDSFSVFSGQEIARRIRYAPGDRLYVRERAHIDGREINYAADLDPGRDFSGLGYRPSIHMPRWASRLTMLVEGVRVERLQDIGCADVLQEGVFAIGEDGVIDEQQTKDSFAELWRSLHGRDSWDANPWVAAISFRVIRANIDAIADAPICEDV
jgi:hypothetical protein